MNAKKRIPKLAIFLASVAVLWACLLGFAAAAEGDAEINANVDGLTVTHTQNGQMQMWQSPYPGVIAGGELSTMLSTVAAMYPEALGGNASMVAGVATYENCLGASMEIIADAPKDTLKFTNNKEVGAVLSFDYQLIAADECTVTFSETSSMSRTPIQNTTLAALNIKAAANGLNLYSTLGIPTELNYNMTEQDEQGHVEVYLEPGETYYVPIDCANTNLSMAYMILTSVSLTEVSGQVVSFQPAEDGTSYTICSADGATTLAEVTDDAESVVLPAEGVKICFDSDKKLAYWWSGSKVWESNGEEGSILLHYAPATVRPSFVAKNSIRPFCADGVYFYSWDDAFNHVGAGGNVFLAETDYTLSSGTYVIPAGKKFIVPHTPRELGKDAGNNPVVAFSAQSGDSTIVNGGKAIPYATLRVGTGTTINVASGGELLVNAELVTSSGAQGQTGTGFGAIFLDGTLNVYGKLTTRGYIVQSNYMQRGVMNSGGLVHAFSGSVVNVVFQILDYRGAMATATAALGGDGAMPISIYSFASIMVKTQYDYGSEFSAYCTIAYIDQTSGMAIVPHVNVSVLSNKSDSLFDMSEDAMLLTDYQYNGDRFIFDVASGTVNLNFIKIPLMGEDASLDTSAFELPLHDGMVINVRDGAKAELRYKAKLLPGAEINVDHGGTLTIKNKFFLYGLQDYKPAYANDKLRMRPNSSFIQNGGSKEAPTCDAILNIGGSLELGTYVNQLNGFEYNGKIIESIHYGGIIAMTSENEEEHAVFKIPNVNNIVVDATEDYTAEVSGSSVETTVDLWKPVSGLIGGMSENENDPKTFYHEALSRIPHNDEYKTATVDGYGYWYRYSVQYNSENGVPLFRHYLAPAYDNVTVEDLTLGGLKYVVTGVSFSDTEGHPIDANAVGSTNITYYGMVDGSETHYTDPTTEYAKAWETLNVSALNLANASGTSTTDVVATLSIQDYSNRVFWSQYGPDNTLIDSWLSYSKADGSVEYLQNGNFGIFDSSVTAKDDGSVLPVSIQSTAESGSAVRLRTSTPITEDVEVSFTTQTEFIHVTFVYPDETISEVDLPYDNGHCGIAVPQPSNKWYVVESASDVTQTGMTVDGVGETVDLSWSGATPGTGAVSLKLTEYVHRITYAVTNGDADGTVLAFDPVYTNAASYEQRSNALKVNGVTGPKYYFADYTDDGTRLLTEDLMYNTVVPVTMKSYDYEVIAYNTAANDAKILVDYVHDGDSSYYELEQGYAWDNITVSAPGSVADCVNATASSNAKLGFSAVHGNSYISAHIISYDSIVTFTDGENELSNQFVAIGEDASYSAPNGKVITGYVCAAEVEHNDDYAELANTVADGWEGVTVKNVQQSMTVPLTLVDYDRRIVWRDRTDSVGEGPVVNTVVQYLPESTTTAVHTPMDGYVFAAEDMNPFSSSATGGSQGIESLRYDSFTLSNITASNVEIDVLVGVYAHRVTFKTGDTVLKTVYVNNDGKDISDLSSNAFYAYGPTLKTFIAGAAATGGATLNEPTTYIFDGSAQSLWSMVEVTDYGEDLDVVVTFTPMVYAHKLTAVLQDLYVDPVQEVYYSSTDTYTRTFAPEEHFRVDSARVVSGAAEVAVTPSGDGFSVTMETGANPKVEIQIRQTTSRFTKAENITSYGGTRETYLKLSNIEVTDEAYGVFTVECTHACFVAIVETIDNADYYTRVLPVNKISDTKYQYDISTVNHGFTSSIQVIVGMKGDFNKDGAINTTDVTRVKNLAKPTSSPTNYEMLALNTNGDTRINTTDVTAIKAAAKTRTYNTITWMK